jgi:hypothetical protein
MTTKVQFRRGLASAWTSANPLLAEGEMGLELDTGYWKIGNGTDLWNVLDYAAPATLTGLIPGAPVFGSSTGTAIQNEAGTAGQFLMSYGDIVNGGPHFVDVSIKESIHVATTEHLDATYNNANITTGDYPVIASSLTMNSIGHTWIDGVELELDDRVLIKDQTNPAHNGIYVVVVEGEDVGEDPANPLGAATVFVRDNDSDTSSKIAAALCQVQNGNINGGQMFTTYFAETDTIGTSPIVYNNIVQTPGTGVAGEFLMSYGGYGVHAPQFVQLNVHEPVDAATTDPIAGTYIVGTTINISAISSNSTTWTFNYTGAPFTGYTPAVGASVVIAGCTPTTYNGTWVVESSTTSQFTVTQGGNPGPGTVFGTATQGDTEINPALTADEFYVATSGILTIDEIDIALDARVLFKDQTNPAQNGVWLCTTAGAPGVAARFSRDNDLDEISKFPASIVQVSAGTVNGGQSFTTYAKATEILGLDPIIWNTVIQGPGTGRAGEFLMSYGGYGANAPQWVQLNVKEPVKYASTQNYPVSTYVKGTELTVTSVTSTPTTWTFNYTDAPYVGYIPVVGQPIDVEHVLPLAYNGTWTVVTASTTHFTVTQAGNPGASTQGGTAEQGILESDPQEPSDYMILTATGSLTVDGSVAALDDRILFKDQTNGYENGIWLVYDDGVTAGTTGHVWLVRDNDSNDASKIAASLAQVQSGTTNGGQVFTTYANTGIMLGVDDIPYNTVVQVPGYGNAGEFLMSYGGAGTYAPQYIQLNVHEPVRCATTADIGTVTYATASYPGINPAYNVDKITVTATGALTVDGLTLSPDDRVLLKDQNAPAQNGVYLVEDDGVMSGTSTHVVLVRDNDTDSIDKLAASLVQVSYGSTNASTTWQANIAQGAVLGTSPINFVKLSSNLSTSDTSAATFTTTGELIVASLKIPQNYLQAGSTYRFRAMIERTGTTSSTDVVSARIGTTTAANAGNVMATWSRAAAVATVSFTVDWTFTVRTSGVSGTISGGGTNVLTATTSLTPATGVATAVAVDTTVNNYMKLTFNQSAANTIGIIYATIEQIV